METGAGGWRGVLDGVSSVPLWMLWVGSAGSGWGRLCACQGAIGELVLSQGAGEEQAWTRPQCGTSLRWASSDTSAQPPV